MDINAVGWFGVRIWIWIYLFISFFGFIGVLVYFHREKIRRIYYEIRFPEKIIKVVIHYSTKLYHEFYRLIPDDNYIRVGNKDYRFDEKNIVMEKDFLLKKDKYKYDAIVNGKTYQVHPKLGIKGKFKNYIEIHYFYNNPNPISFEISKKKIELSSKQMQEYKDNDLFTKLLTLDYQKNSIVILFLLCGINILISGFILAKMMGWLQ